MDILIGTRNAYKKGEMIWFLGDNPKIKIHFLDEFNLNIKVEEDKESLIKTAEKKAKEISKHTDFYVLTSDGGVDIPGLGERWNLLKNQRTVGENNSDLVKANNLLSLMKDLKGEERKVSYHLALALAKNGRLIWSKGDVIDKGYITEQLIDENIPKYFWMGQIWYYPEFKKISTRLNKKEQGEVRKQGKWLRESLVKQLKKFI